MTAPQATPVEITEARHDTVGSTPVRRALPRRGRRTIGAWCFADHMGPAPFSETHSIDVGPHPHIGLQTVTWLIEGAILHRDSLGSEQVIRPGQLNLMTAGHGVSHSEEHTGTDRGTLEGIQLWVALPEATRHGEAAFEHHRDLPRFDTGSGPATVLMGELADHTAPARHDTPLVGAELDLHDGVSLPLRADFEHGLVVLRGAVVVDGQRLEPGRLGYLAPGRDEVRVDVDGPSRVMLIGGEPFPERVTMWWNYVARDMDEIRAAHRAWTDRDARFGTVRSALAPIDTAPPRFPG